MVKRPFRYLFLLLLAALSVSGFQTPGDGYIRSPRLGITFINTGNQPNAAERYRNGLLLGAGWTRYPFYWNSLETSPGGWNWGAYDPQVIDDVRYGLRINAILLGIPSFRNDGGAPQGLYAPVFTDGTDIPGAGKSINPSNAFATFAAQLVTRYKPGGTLASQMGWGGDTGIRVWEIWNEPDLGMFWTGGVENYARMLKVGYLAIHAADPYAQVMFAGLAFNNPDQLNWLDRTLAVLAQDSQARAYNWYFDIAAVHAYSSSLRSGVMVRRIRETLARYGLTRPIWLNESGVPVWDDYPGPTWTGSNPTARLYRGTMIQQAAYVIQSAAYAWANGADVVFIHQLYDDCGNQPGGTDFAPNTGNAGDAFGLFRNIRGFSCFSQHPQPGTPRPAATSYRLLAQTFGTGTLANGQVVNLNNRGVLISFDRMSPGNPAVVEARLYVLWGRSGDWVNAQIPASGGSAVLYTMDNQDFVISPTDGVYTIGLQPASPPGYPSLSREELAQIGAPPYIMIETVWNGASPADPAMAHLEGEQPVILGDATPTAEESGGTGEQPILGTLPPPQTVMPTTAPTLIPTLDPALDTTPPQPFVEPLPPVSATPFTVVWGAVDDSGIASYIVWVRIDSGDWGVWLETADSSAAYPGEPGHGYEFAVWAQDLGGNWSQNLTIEPMASTRVE